MKQYQKDFIEFALQQGVLLFGEFKLKSGRISPYFFNAGQFNTGKVLSTLGYFYASAIVDAGYEYDVLLGPAYKGIPLVSATAIALAEKFHINSSFCFNRKETKMYGEGGNIIGAKLQGRVLVVDDVISAGTTFRESAALIKTLGAELVGVVTAMDRQERGQTQLSAAQEIANEYGIKVTSIITLQHLIEYLELQLEMADKLKSMRAYQSEYGVD